jgi:hypothetical protein
MPGIEAKENIILKPNHTPGLRPIHHHRRQHTRNQRKRSRQPKHYRGADFPQDYSFAQGYAWLRDSNFFSLTSTNYLTIFKKTNNTFKSNRENRMPTVLRVGPYRFYFFSNEGNEPPHIHVKSGKDIAKFWLSPIEIASNHGFRAHELNNIEQIIG